jgi:MFS family permease
MDLEARPEHQPAALIIYVISTLTLLGAAGISPILPVLMRGLALTEPQAGLVMTVYTLPVIFVVPFVGWVADRVGRRPPLIAGLVTFGVAGALIFFVSDFRTILGLRLVQGIGYSGVSPLTITMLGDLFDDDAEAGAQGLRVVSVNLGGFAFPIVTGALAGIAWNVPFLLFLSAIPAGILVLWWLPEGETDLDSDQQRARVHLGTVLGTIREPLIAGTLALGFVRFFMAYGVFTFLPLLITDNGIGVGQVGLAIGTIGGVKVLVASQSRRSFNAGPPAITMAGALLASGLMIATFVSADTLPAFVVLAGAYGLSEGVIAPLQKTVLTQNADRTVRASVVSANAVLKNLGKTAAPVALGVFVSSHGLTDGFLYLGVGGAIASGLLLVAFVYESTDRELTDRA